MANRPFTMNIRHVNIMVKTCNKFKFKNSKYFQLSYFQLFQYTIMRQTKVLNLNLLCVLPFLHHYILAYLGIYGITNIEDWKLTSLRNYTNYISQNSSKIIKKLKRS